MGATQSKQSDYVNCSFVHNAVLSSNPTILIHAMKIEDEHILIHKTLTATEEVDKINLLISEHNFEQNIIIYGYSHMDLQALLLKKQKLHAYGFDNVFIYLGGMFEWLLLRDVYGEIEFPVDGLAKGSVFLDILKYAKPQ